MKAAAQKASDAPQTKTEPAPRDEPPRDEPPRAEPPRDEPPRDEPPRAEPPQAEALQVWAFLCPSPMCDTELIIFPEQTGQWVECPSCGLQLRAPEVVPGKAEALYPRQRPSPRRKARLSPEEVAWLALQAGGKAAAGPKPTPAEPRTAPLDALAREVARTSAARAEAKAAEPAAPEPQAAAPGLARAADALDSLAHGAPPNTEPPSDADEEPTAPGNAEKLRFHDDAQPLPESTLRDTAPKPLEEPLAEPVVRRKPVLEATPVTPLTRPRRAAATVRPNTPWEIGSSEGADAATPDLPIPAAGPARARPARTFRSDLLVVWIVAVVTAAGVGFLAWASGLPDLAAGSILAIGVAVLWTFFGRPSGDPLRPDGRIW